MINLFLAELERRWRLFKAYPMEEVASTFIFAVFFYGLFLGASYMAGPAAAQFGQRLDAIVVGYVAWLLVIDAFQGIAAEVQNEAKTGTLQQLIMSPHGTRVVFLVRSVANLTVSVCVISCVLVLISLLTGSHVTFSPLVLLPVVTVIAGTLGLGFLIGALALTLKRVQILVGVFNFVLLFMVMTPLETMGMGAKISMAFLPLVEGVGMLRTMMAQGGTFETTSFLIATANSAIWLLVGLTVFRRAEDRSKRRGSIAAF